MFARPRPISLSLSLLVVAATCMCVCTMPATAMASTAHVAHSCCEPNQRKAAPAQHPTPNHDDCRICGLKIWSNAEHSPGAQITVAPLFLARVAPFVALTPPALDLSPRIHEHHPPPLSSLSLFDLRCQLLC